MSRLNIICLNPKLKSKFDIKQYNIIECENDIDYNATCILLSEKSSIDEYEFINVRYERIKILSSVILMDRNYNYQLESYEYDTKIIIIPNDMINIYRKIELMIYNSGADDEYKNILLYNMLNPNLVSPIDSIR